MNRPNIVLILIDDMGWMDLGCYGSSFYETPNLDLLARRSMRFTHAYAACPVCSPTRASIMTGKYPARLGLTTWIGADERGRLIPPAYVRQLPLQEQNLARALSAGGYATWHVGKWHLGQEEKYWPHNQGFDVNIGGWAKGSPTSYFSPYSNPMLSDGPPGEYLTDRLTDEAIGLVRDRDVSRPFFLNLWYYQVHIPIQGKPEYVAKYQAKARALGLDRKDPFEVGEHFPVEHKRDLRVTRRLFQSDCGYAAMVQSLDENVGRLLAELEAQGIADNTVIIFTSDNGGLSSAEGSPTCNAPLSEGKGWMYDGGLREPLIVHWPGVTQPDSICEQPVTSPDVFPTMLEIAALEPLPNQHVDGISIVPLLRGDTSLERDAIFWHFPHYGNQGCTPGAALRSGPWKLIEFFETGKLELYNLVEDVGESNNLAASQPQLAQQLRQKLHNWIGDVGGKMPSPNADWRQDS